MILKNIIMKKIIVSLIISIAATALFSQQEAIFSQFTAHKILYNPGYTGSSEVPCFSLTHREQWVGLDGAPSTSAFAAHSPILNGRVGLGLSILNDNIGYYNIMTVNGLYSYRILFEDSFLSLGVQGSYRRYDGDETQVSTTHGGDPLTEQTIEPFNIFNVGFGIYYESKNYFLGASMPRLLKKSLNGEVVDDLANNAGELRHFYLMGGVIVPISEKLRLKPAFLTQYVKNAPINFDLHLSLGFEFDLWVGATYRWGTHPQSGQANSSISAIVEYHWSGFKIGAAYDYGLGKIQNGNIGTFELMLGYCLHKNRMIPNPRFF